MCVSDILCARLCQVFYLILHNCKLQLQIFYAALRVSFDYDSSILVENGTFLKTCSDHRNESRHDTMNAHQARSQIRDSFPFFSPGAIRENGIRENTSYAAPISIDFPSFRSVRSYDGQIFRSACLPSPIPRPTTVRSTNSKLISGTRPFFGEREGWVVGAPGRPVIVNPLGAPGSPWSLCYDRTLGTRGLGHHDKARSFIIRWRK